jgi:hypothetical protein
LAVMTTGPATLIFFCSSGEVMTTSQSNLGPDAAAAKKQLGSSPHGIVFYI